MDSRKWASIVHLNPERAVSTWNYREMTARAQNEKKFGQWMELPDGGRRSWLEVTGRHGWRARYVKEVDANETTVRFWQEVYDDRGELVELHERFPVDKGHRKV